MEPEPAGGGCPFLVRRLADSGPLRERVEAAHNLGISLKRFDGWEPAVTTVYEYDDAGRLARSVATAEQEWDEHEQELMLAFEVLQRLTCDGCGGHLPDTTRMGAEYVAELPIRCHRCTAMGRQADIYHREEVPQPQALRFPTRLRTTGGEP